MVAKKKRVMKKPFRGPNIQPRLAEPEPKPEPVYTATQKKQYHNAEYGVTPSHPQLRESHFPRNIQPDVVKKQANKSKMDEYMALMMAVMMQGFNRRRIELERGIADDVEHYNAIIVRMREQLGTSLDQLILPFPRPRTHLDQYNDVDAMTRFLGTYWEIAVDGQPLPEAELRRRVENAYNSGKEVQDQTFSTTYKGPGYGDGFKRVAQKLLREAQRAVKAGKLK